MLDPRHLTEEEVIRMLGEAQADQLLLGYVPDETRLVLEDWIEFTFGERRSIEWLMFGEEVLAIGWRERQRIKKGTQAAWLELQEQIEQTKDAVRLAELEKGQYTTIGSYPNRSGHFRRRVIYSYVAAAASVLFATLIFLLIRFNEHNQSSAIAERDVAPGGYHAILRLGDGKQLMLDSIKRNSVLANQGNATVLSTGKGELAYQQTGKNNGQILYNTLLTRTGDTYKVILPDGSSVWLNSESSLHFPTSFSGETRDVTLDGEGYFEIKPDAAHPFIVHTPKETIRVLGTKFDILTYSNEPSVSTSLLDGAIEVNAGQNHRTLRNPSQITLSSDGSLTAVEHPNLEATVAWKDGIFFFEDAPLSSIMRQLARWYDIDVEFRDVSANKTFNAYILRSLPISRILQLMEQTHEVDFDIQGKKVLVKKFIPKPKE